MEAPQIAPQAQPQQQQPVAPQQAPAQAPQAGSAPQTQGQPSGREGQAYNPDVLPMIEKHLNTIPKEQQAFLAQYMTPELAMVLGIVLGKEALDYFKQFADPKKMLVVQPRPDQQQGQAQQPQQGAAPQQAQGGGAGQPSPQTQQANPPQANIMGV